MVSRGFRSFSEFGTLMIRKSIRKTRGGFFFVIIMPNWKPVPYYYTGPLKNVTVPSKLPHKLGYIPKYLKNFTR